MADTAKVPLDQVPGLAPPPGILSNFDSHNHLNDVLIGTTTSCVILTTLFMAARLILRARVDKTMKIEDYTSIACWMGFATYNGIALAIGAAGAGRHQWDVSVASIIRIGLLGNVIEIVYGPTVWLAKLSVVLQYLSIFVTAKRGLIYWSIHLLIWSNFLFYLIDTFVIIFLCRPREKIWNFLLPGTCLNAHTNFIVTGAWNVFSDFMILALPFYAIWHLKMPLKRKLGIAAIFASGLFACITSIFRLYYSVKLANTDDVTYIFMQVALWGLAELATVVLCGSVVILPKFFQLLRGKPRQSASAYSSYGSGPASFNRKRRYQGKLSQALPSSSSAPWADADGLLQTTDVSHIPLEERLTSNEGTQTSTFQSSQPTNGGIMKTVNIETDVQHFKKQVNELYDS